VRARPVLLVAAALASPGLVLAAAAPAAAERPAAGCASPFEALTLEEQIALGERLGYKESSVRAAHAKYDKNGNDVLCVRVDKAEDGKGVVLVDDTARA